MLQNVDKRVRLTRFKYNDIITELFYERNDGNAKVNHLAKFYVMATEDLGRDQATLSEA